MFIPLCAHHKSQLDQPLSCIDCRRRISHEESVPTLHPPEGGSSASARALGASRHQGPRREPSSPHRSPASHGSPDARARKLTFSTANLAPALGCGSSTTLFLRLTFRPDRYSAHRLCCRAHRKRHARRPVIDAGPGPPFSAKRLLDPASRIARAPMSDFIKRKCNWPGTPAAVKRI
jgi:hypothetical protein